MTDTDSIQPSTTTQTERKETKVIYHVDDEGTPYMLTIPKPPSEVTLADFKEKLNRPAAKFFFKSKDEEVGIVKEEVSDDTTILPLFNGRIVSWIVTNDGSGSDVKSDKTGSGRLRKTPELDDDDTTTLASGISGVPRPRKTKKQRNPHRHKHRAIDSVSQYGETDTVTEMESSVWDESDLTSMASYSTMTSISTLAKGKRRVLTKTRPPPMPRVYSSSTLAESTFSESLQIITVTLRMDHINFLGISIMGQNAEDGVGGIFVGSIMNGGAVAADGRIQAGDLILNVNEVDFSNLTNDEAVKVLRDVVQANGPITMTVARPTYEGMEEIPSFEPRNEPIHPMDPAMWLHHTQSQSKPLQFNQHMHGRSPTSTTLTSDSGSQATSNSMPEADRDLVTKLTLATPINLVARAMAATNSGLERKDHKWLKMKIPNSFLGSSAVDWLFTNVEGFIDRRHAKKYCSLMLKDAYIKHTVNKLSFSEQCYYVFGDIFSPSKTVYKTPSELEHAMGKMTLNTGSSESGDADTIAGELPPVVPWSSEECLPPAYSEVRSSGSESGGHGGKKGKRTGTPDSHGSGNHKLGIAMGGRLTRDHRVGSILSSASTDFTSVSQQRPGSNRRMPDVDQISIISGRSLAQMRAQVLSKKEEDKSAVF